MTKDFNNQNKVDKLLKNYSSPDTTDEATKAKKKNTTDGIKRAYYLTPEQDKAIALKAAIEGMKKNEVVQEALNEYLADYLNKKEE